MTCSEPYPLIIQLHKPIKFPLFFKPFEVNFLTRTQIQKHKRRVSNPAQGIQGKRSQGRCHLHWVLESAESEWKEKYSKQTAGEENNTAPICHKSQVAELGVARDGMGGSRNNTLCPVHQAKVLEFGPAEMGLEQGMTGSGWHFRQDFLTTVEDGVERSVGRRSGGKREGSEEALAYPARNDEGPDGSRGGEEETTQKYFGSHIHRTW